ncbi:MAG: PadR family transcriptional regulator [Anaerolineaceae bacterium]|nr:PadR family transcriptional regulator [Anaerolineaceae bacterium]
MSANPAEATGLEYALLGFLSRQPRHGYDLHKELSNLEGIGLVWHVKQAHLYALLDKLENRGLVTSQVIASDTYPPRKEYKPTQAGIQAFEKWMLSPVEHGRELRQDFLTKLYFARLQGGDTAGRVVEAQREFLFDLQARLENKDKHLSDSQSFEKQVYQFRIKQIRAFIDWLDTCLMEY